MYMSEKTKAKHHRRLHNARASIGNWLRETSSMQGSFPKLIQRIAALAHTEKGRENIKWNYVRQGHSWNHYTRPVWMFTRRNQVADALYPGSLDITFMPDKCTTDINGCILAVYAEITYPFLKMLSDLGVNIQQLSVLGGGKLAVKIRQNFAPLRMEKITKDRGTRYGVKPPLAASTEEISDAEEIVAIAAEIRTLANTIKENEATRERLGQENRRHEITKLNHLERIDAIVKRMTGGQNA